MIYTYNVQSFIFGNLDKYSIVYPNLMSLQFFMSVPHSYFISTFISIWKLCFQILNVFFIAKQLKLNYETINSLQPNQRFEKKLNITWTCMKHKETASKTLRIGWDSWLPGLSPIFLIILENLSSALVQ